MIQDLRDVGRAGDRRVGQQHHELLSPIANLDVTVSQLLVHPLSNRGEQRIAAQVPVLIVDRLEVVQVHYEEGNIDLLSLASLELRVQDLHTLSSIEAPRERVQHAMLVNLLDEVHVVDGYRDDGRHGGQMLSQLPDALGRHGRSEHADSVCANRQVKTEVAVDLDSMNRVEIGGVAVTDTVRPGNQVLRRDLRAGSECLR